MELNFKKRIYDKYLHILKLILTIERVFGIITVVNGNYHVSVVW